MIAHVDLETATEWIERQEGADLAARRAQRFEQALLEVIGTHGVVEESDLDAFLGFGG